ncbi:hypothetical protein ACVWY2_009663 [Bradyrhizobium sp. JR6.1]
MPAALPSPFSRPQAPTPWDQNVVSGIGAGPASGSALIGNADLSVPA